MNRCRTVVFCPAPVHEAVWTVKRKMNVASLCDFRLIIVSRKNGCWIWELSHPSWQAHDTAVSRNQHNFLVKAVTWRIKLQAFYLRYTRTRSDTGFEPDEILVTLGTMCVTPERFFLSATNACSSKSKNTCAINTSTDRLQLLGKTCRTALQKV